MALSSSSPHRETLQLSCKTHLLMPYVEVGNQLNVKKQMQVMPFILKDDNSAEVKCKNGNIGSRAEFVKCRCIALFIFHGIIQWVVSANARCLLQLLFNGFTLVQRQFVKGSRPRLHNLVLMLACLPFYSDKDGMVCRGLNEMIWELQHAWGCIFSSSDMQRSPFGDEQILGGMVRKNMVSLDWASYIKKNLTTENHFPVRLILNIQWWVY